MAECFWTDLVKCVEDCGSEPPATPFAIYDFTAAPYALADRSGGPTEPLVWEVPYTTELPPDGAAFTFLNMSFDAQLTPTVDWDTFDSAAYTEFDGAEYAINLFEDSEVDEGENTIRMGFPNGSSDVSLEVGAAGMLRLVITPARALVVSNVFVFAEQPN